MMDSKVKEKYKRTYGRHKVHAVGRNKEIVIDERRINDFAVKLKIRCELAVNTNCRDEARQYFENFNGLEGDDIESCCLFDDDHRITFIRGIAGMGKSVLAKQLIYGWANGDIYQNFKMCVMFECRDLNYFKDNDGAKLEEHEILGEFLKSKINYDFGDGEGVLIIVDGLDELYDINEKHSIIVDLLSVKGKYGMSKVIITGRPHVEHKLEGYDIDMGGLQRVEIIWLDNEQIHEYIDKFASCQDDASIVTKAMESCMKLPSMIRIPQFLNTFYCVALMSDGSAIEDQGELYCWTIYLFLKQHADKYCSIKKAGSDIFQEFSQTLVALSKVCHDMLIENKIIFEGDLNSLLGKVEKGKDFIKSLFVDVSGDFGKTKKYQFKHLSLMEFLSAVHICKDMKYSMDNVRCNLEKGFFEVISFVCCLISGFPSKSVITELLDNVADVADIDAGQFLNEVLGLLQGCVIDEETKLKRSFEIITHFLNEEFTEKQLMKSILANCSGSLLSSPGDIDNLATICNHLEFTCGWVERDIRAALKNVLMLSFDTTKLETLDCLRYLALQDGFRGIWLRWIRANAVDVRKKFEDKLISYCKDIWVIDCEFQDRQIDRRTFQGKVNRLHIRRCKLNNMNSFMNLWYWGMSCERFYLWDLDIDLEWWNAFGQALEERAASTALRLWRLTVRDCTTEMSEELKTKELHSASQPPPISSPPPSANHPHSTSSSSLSSSSSSVSTSSSTLSTSFLASSRSLSCHVQEDGTPSKIQLPRRSLIPVCSSGRLPAHHSRRKPASGVALSLSNAPNTGSTGSRDVNKSRLGAPAVDVTTTTTGWSGFNLNDRYCLADSLESDKCNSLNQFIDQCDYCSNPRERTRILYNLSPCIAFFENLVCLRPQTSLAEIKDCIENNSNSCNRAIFKKVERAIERQEVTFNLQYTLLDLKANEKHWTFVLDHVASELVDKEMYGLPTWKDVAGYFDYSVENINMLETRNHCDDRPTLKLLSYLQAIQPDLDIKSYLVQILTKIQRLDIIQKCNLVT